MDVLTVSTIDPTLVLLSLLLAGGGGDDGDEAGVCTGGGLEGREDCCCCSSSAVGASLAVERFLTGPSTHWARGTPNTWLAPPLPESE